jgi:predicted phage-related endonuclease
MDEALRDELLCGSEVGVVYHVDPYRDEFTMWARKHRLIERGQPNLRMLTGSMLEHAMLVDIYPVLAGREVIPNRQTFRHSQWPWVGYTPDGFTKDGDRIVDSKIVFQDQRWIWGYTAEESPDHIWLQMQWYMMATGLKYADLIVWVGGEGPRIITIPAEPEIFAGLRARTKEWHERYIVGDERPEITGSEGAREWIKQAFKNHRRPDIRPANEEEQGWLAEYIDVRLDEVEIVGMRDELENKLKHAIGNSEGLSWPGGKFTWRKTKDSKKIHWENIARGLLNQFVPNEEERETLIGLQTSVEEGYRRIHLSSDYFAEEKKKLNESEAA